MGHIYMEIYIYFGLWGMVLKHVYAAFLQFRKYRKRAYREKFQGIQLQAHNNHLFDLELDFRRKFGTEMDQLDFYAQKF